MSDGKKAVVTGGIRGIGLQIALLLKERGYMVCATYSKDEKSASEAERHGLSVAKFDVGNEEETVSFFQKFGRVDVLVNCAGVSLIKQVQDTTLSDWEKVFSTNTTGTFLCSREAVKNMLTRKDGVIVNISSVWGETGASCETAYSASKSAVIGFTKALAKELALSSIRVNCVSPGAIDTKMNDCFSFDEKREIESEIPLGRFGTGKEVALAVLSLIENPYVTGVDLPVGGGYGF